jgi:uncharacterized membrane protein
MGGDSGARVGKLANDSVMLVLPMYGPEFLVDAAPLINKDTLEATKAGVETIEHINAGISSQDGSSQVSGGAGGGGGGGCH